ncbi:3-hydroxyacyl-CoA dehydrogenase/enoyl-CoA hydratase family protein [Cohnella hashimotonis]|uniref:3-hydroxyacyl-CoA dehydrogenase NAD-binding domain-containing protein n=1 Tax=Cohnella hashimotonis TaxID=2826895 RepID=A0ABT6TLK3_9BACL|nr:3-hydroxyacyl-CoA dehydrogenase/enoyl-CoA hydratase family protein [Cohnella hashimotonis]MDI4646692.1 3-hydroxyacyl-CoA dehydrogenase NAD-binding domain-containing protein [Cohnella hashimotonis]
MALKIRKAAVIGSGVMGASIAAHLANAGVPSLLLDIVPDSLAAGEEAKGLTLADSAVRNRLALGALARLPSVHPSPFYDDAFASLIEPGNIDDDLHRIRKVDWVIEAVVEKLSVKRDVLERIERYWRTGLIVSSNTSGISIREMAEGRSEAFKAHFLGTHFFNPPRYMKLLELIPGQQTDPAIVSGMAEFAERILGKGVVVAKDTPNFVANRIGTYGLLATLQAMEAGGFTVEEVDAVTGPAIGRPKSATLRTLDLVGIDTFLHVANNVFEKTDDPAEKAAFAPSKLLRELASRGWIGEKACAGFYKKVKGAAGSEILSLDPGTMTYVQAAKPSGASLEAAAAAKGAKEKTKALLGGKDRYADLAWQILKQTLIYSAEKVGEIAGSVDDIDKAMRWGFNWELGPFELWDAIGLVRSAARMEADGAVVPGWVKDWIAAGNPSFYRREKGHIAYSYRGVYRDLEERPDTISLRTLKEQGRVVRSNAGASLIDVGDGVAALEFHSRSNAIGGDILSMIGESVEEVRRNYDALVIANEGRNFCVGANLMLLLMEAQDEEWDEVDAIIRLFQDTMTKLKRFEKPVVAAPHRMALGGGVEVCLPADKIVMLAETYFGLVEAGVGLIPAGGGCKELALRISGDNPDPEIDLQPHVNRLFLNIGTAKVSTSAHDAKKLGYLRAGDRIVMSQERLVHEAKRSALRLAQTGIPAPVPQRIRVVGAEGKAVMKLGARGMHTSGYISNHDLLIAGKLAHVLAGGDVPAGTFVTEQYMLDLEREAFLSLCGEPKTQQRMQHMLARGKALRN